MRSRSPSPRWGHEQRMHGIAVVCQKSVEANRSHFRRDGGRGVRVQSARCPARHAVWASAAPMQLSPTPVLPTTITLCLERTHGDGACAYEEA